MWKSFVLIVAVTVQLAAAENYRVCVAQSAAESCLKLVQLAGLQISCVPALDRADCLDKIKGGDADFTQVDPEDMYVAARMQGQNFKIFSEVRASDNLDEDHRYEAVAVIRNSLTLSDIRDLKGKSSCHTGIGRTVGYKVPVTRLVQLGVLEPLTDPELTPRENELRALSRAFSRACIVGKWAPDVETDRRLKSSYSNLCALCQNPGNCDANDRYSGYNGAIKCVNENEGDVAWTKYSEARNFFGLNPDKTAEADPAGFSFLCRDGSRRPVTGPPCSWAARPWQAYLSSGDDKLNVEKLRQELLKAQRWVETTTNTAGTSLLQATLGLTAIQQTIVPRAPISPQDFLLNSHYSDVIEREVGSVQNKVRVCVDAGTLKRCHQLSEVAYSRDIRPRLECLTAGSCVEAVQRGDANIVVLGPHQAYLASRNNDIHALIALATGDDFIVAVTPVTSSVTSIRDIGSGSVCIESTPGAHYAYFSTLGTEEQGRQRCTPNGLLHFSACGAVLTETNKFSAVEIKGLDTCNQISSTEEHPSEAILSCLQKDVAFVSSRRLASLSDGASRFRLLCQNGSSEVSSQVKQCNLLQVPSKALGVSNYLGEARVEEIRMAALDLNNLLTKRPHLFNLMRSTASLQLIDPGETLYREYNTRFDDFSSKCHA